MLSAAKIPPSHFEAMFISAHTGADIDRHDRRPMNRLRICAMSVRSIKEDEA